MEWDSEAWMKKETTWATMNVSQNTMNVILHSLMEESAQVTPERIVNVYVSSRTAVSQQGEVYAYPYITIP